MKKKKKKMGMYIRPSKRFVFSETSLDRFLPKPFPASLPSALPGNLLKNLCAVKLMENDMDNLEK